MFFESKCRLFSSLSDTEVIEGLKGIKGLAWYNALDPWRTANILDNELFDRYEAEVMQNKFTVRFIQVENWVFTKKADYVICGTVESVHKGCVIDFSVLPSSTPLLIYFTLGTILSFFLLVPFMMLFDKLFGEVDVGVILCLSIVITDLTVALLIKFWMWLIKRRAANLLWEKFSAAEIEDTIVY